VEWADCLQSQGHSTTERLVVRQKQEAQLYLPQRDSASASHVFLGSFTDSALQSLATGIQQMQCSAEDWSVSTLSANKPCNIRTLS